MDSSDGYLGFRLDDFLGEVASPDPAPGSGFVAAVAVAMAAGLVTMAARLSRDSWSEARGAAAQAETLRLRVAPLAERNVRAYLEAVALLKQAGSSQGGARDDRMARALERSAEIPLEIGRAASDVALLAATVAEEGEPSLRADAAVAASLALAGARAAATLIEVNLATTADDERLELGRELVADASAAHERALGALA